MNPASTSESNTTPLTDKADDIRRLCRRFGVLRLDLFGSAARDQLQSDSDIDLVVTFSESDQGLFDRYFALREALQELLGRPIDLVTDESIRNPYFRASVDASRINVYHRSYP
jgi:predicted nucleotidyltransferase